MFTGIIEDLATLQKVEEQGTNRSFHFRCPIAVTFRPEESISHNGVCLTVENVSGEEYTVTAVAETLAKTALKHWEAGIQVNIERAMALNGRFHGHIVQGHVDCTAVCRNRTDRNGSTEFSFQLNQPHAGLLVEKGSLTVDGVSLTIFNVTPEMFSVAIIPYTLRHTAINQWQPGTEVNLEFDVIGKYVQSILAARQ